MPLFCEGVSLLLLFLLLFLLSPLCAFHSGTRKSREILDTELNINDCSLNNNPILNKVILIELLSGVVKPQQGFVKNHC